MACYTLNEDIPWDEFLIESDDETKLRVNGKTLTATKNLEVGDEVTIRYCHKQGYIYYCKVYIMEAVPTVSRNLSSKIGTEIKSTDTEPVKFEDVFQASNIPDGWTLGFQITDSDMLYYDICHNIYNTDSPIDATDIELIKGENGLYSLGNIKYYSYDSLEDGKQYKLTGRIRLYDEKGNLVKEFAPNTFYIQKNDELKVTIGDHTETATDEKTVNMGTVYLAENRTINIKDIAKLTGYYNEYMSVTSSDPSIVSVTSDYIQTQAYNSNMADKITTLTFTGGGRTVTVDVKVCKLSIEIFRLYYNSDNDNTEVSYEYIDGATYDVSDSTIVLKIESLSYSCNIYYIDNSNVGDVLDENGYVQSGIKSGDTQTIRMRDEYGNDYSVTLKY